MTTDCMMAMKELNKKSLDVAFDVLTHWAEKKEAIIVTDEKPKPLIESGFFEVDETVSTRGGFTAIKPIEYGAKIKPEQLTIGYDTVTIYIPALLEMFTELTGIKETMPGGKRMWGSWTQRWRNPMIEMINTAPGETVKDQANNVARAMPKAIAKQRETKFKIHTPQSILRFVVGEYPGLAGDSGVLEVK